MRRLTLVILFVAVAVTWSERASAQASKSKPVVKTPTAAAVLDGYVKAIGGRKAIESHKTLTMSGTLEVVNIGLKGTVEIVSKEPSKIAVTTTIDGPGTTRQGYDGKSGWSEDPLSGLRDMDAREIALVERSVFSSDVRWREVWKTAEFVGTQTVDGRSVNVVRLTPARDAGSPTTNFYDAESGLLVRTEMVIETTAATMPVTTTLSDYRKIGDVLIAMRMEQSLPTATLVTQFSEVKFDQKIDDAVFAKPAR